MDSIMVVGQGGRESAMVWKLAKNPYVKIFCAPGNAGTAEFATNVDIKADDIDGLLAFASAARINLTIFGPEIPLIKGGVDRFREAGLLACGPTQEAARAEGDKAFFKRLLEKYKIPTAPFEIFDDPQSALAYVRDRGPRNIVIKANGPMAGKGVALPETLGEAVSVLGSFMVKDTAGERVVIEDRLFGVERSATAAVAGDDVAMFPFAKDNKRILDGDIGPNTGGMGTSTLMLSPHEELELTEMTQAIANAMVEEGCPFNGIMYPGFMKTSEGAKVLELNVRFGDPEAQVILPSIDDDFVAMCFALARGNLSHIPAPVRKRHALCIVQSSGDYPASSMRDDPIAGINEAKRSGALVFHAGTALRPDGAVTTNKQGRVLNIVGISEDQHEAHAIAYDAAQKVYFPGIHFRQDIAF